MAGQNEEVEVREGEEGIRCRKELTSDSRPALPGGRGGERFTPDGQYLRPGRITHFSRCVAQHSLWSVCG